MRYYLKLLQIKYASVNTVDRSKYIQSIMITEGLDVVINSLKMSVKDLFTQELYQQQSVLPLTYSQ